MSAIPPQLPWRRFVCVLRDLGYQPLKSHRGSLRQFFCRTRDPILFSFHEPHSGEMLHKRALPTVCADSISARMNSLNCSGGIDTIQEFPKIFDEPHPLGGDPG
jgi:hypothetical protein